MKEVTLETERLLLRWFREEDFEDFCHLCAEPEVMRFLGDGKPMAPMEVWKQMATFMGHWYFRGYGIWAVEEKASGRMVGMDVGSRKLGQGLCNRRGATRSGICLYGNESRSCY
jgi:RimJ/RimL family protein N-acetyltransferase